VIPHHLSANQVKPLTITDDYICILKKLSRFNTFTDLGKKLVHNAIMNPRTIFSGASGLHKTWRETYSTVWINFWYI